MRMMRFVFCLLISVAVCCLVPQDTVGKEVGSTSYTVLPSGQLGDLTSAKFFGDRGDLNMLLLKAVLEGKRDDVEECLKRGADVNHGPIFTPLEAAVQKNHKDLVTLLLERGAQVNTQLSPCPPNEPCPTALIYAVHAGHADLVECMLKHGADPNRKSRGIYVAQIENLSGDTFAINMTAHYEDVEKTALGWARDPKIREILKTHGVID
jgi:hypothetical protein